MPRKKVVTLFDLKPKETPLSAPEGVAKEYFIEVVAPPGFPPVAEPLLSTKEVPGSILWLPRSFMGDRSFLDSNTDKLALTLSVIAELDKGNAGAFNNAYFMNCNILTPDLKQFETFKAHIKAAISPDKNPTEDEFMGYFGSHMRNYLRGIAFRFFSYYFMKYKVVFTEKVVVPEKTPVVETAPEGNPKQEESAV